MKNKVLFDRTISILIKAYQQGRLKHNEPCACAIGNMVSASNNYEITRINGEKYWKKPSGRVIKADWTCVHSYGQMGKENFSFDLEQVNGKAQLESTGYSIEETCKIEFAFEYRKRTVDRDGYKGLMAVVDCLMKIHEAHADEIKGVKELFVKI